MAVSHFTEWISLRYSLRSTKIVDKEKPDLILSAGDFGDEAPLEMVLGGESYTLNIFT